jgi:RNA polymerase sigma-70 factor (ECF subfamily)
LPHPDLDWVRRSLVAEEGSQIELLTRLMAIPKTLAMRNARLGCPLDRGEIEDVAQEVVSLVWEKRAEYAGQCAFEGWVYRFCVLGFLGYWRRRRRFPARLSSTRDERAEPGPENDFLQHERLRASLDDLDFETREIIRQKHFDSRTFEEIAASRECSPNTVKTRYYRGLVRLRKRLESSSPIRPHDERTWVMRSGPPSLAAKAREGGPESSRLEGGSPADHGQSEKRRSKRNTFSVPTSPASRSMICNVQVP